MNDDAHVFVREGEPRLEEPFHYTASGLPDVWLANGVTFHDEGEYGRSWSIADSEGLHGLLAMRIVIRSDRLMTGPELRFVRKRMGLSQAALAERLRVTDQTVANYEKGVTPIAGPADFALRALFAYMTLPAETAAEFMKAFMERREIDMVDGSGARRTRGKFIPPKNPPLPGLPVSAWAEAA